MNTIAQKLELIHWITELKDVSILETLQIVKEQSSNKDWWNTISDTEKTLIKEGLEDSKQGKLVAHSKVKKRYEKWLTD